MESTPFSIIFIVAILLLSHINSHAIISLKKKLYVYKYWCMQFGPLWSNSVHYGLI